MMEPSSIKKAEPVSGTQSLDRGLALLLTIADSAPPGLSLAECTEILGLSRATTRRMLQTLVRREFLVLDPDLSVYSLGPTNIALGSEYLRRIDIRRQALPHMEKLVDATSETAHLGVLRGHQVVYIELVESTEPVRIFSRIGDAVPAYATAIGKAVLAWLEPDELTAHLPKLLTPRTPNTITEFDLLLRDLVTTRERGFAIDDRENREQVRGYAAPIFNHEDRVVAAVSIGGPSDRITATMEPALTHKLIRTARAISLELGATARSLGRI